MLTTFLFKKYREKLKEVGFLSKPDVWHYTSAQGLHGILKNNSIWFSDRRFLNDKTECSYIYDLIKELLKEGTFDDFDDFLLFWLDEITREFSTVDLDCNKLNKIFVQCYVASFTLSRDNLSLWNYYTKNQQHVGYSIKMNANKLNKKMNEFIKDKRYWFIDSKVIYSKKEQKNLLVPLLKDYNNLYIQYKKNKKINFDEDCFLFELINLLDFYNLFFKPTGYSIEQEYRLVIVDAYPISQEKNPHKEIRLWNDIYIPYIEMKGVNSLIKEIMVSPATNQNLLKNSVTLLKDSYDLQNTKVTKSKIPLRY